MRTRLLLGGGVALSFALACGPGPDPVPAEPVMFQLRVRGFPDFGNPNVDYVLFQHAGPRQSGFLPFTYQFGPTDVGQVATYPLVYPTGDPFRISALLRASDLPLTAYTLPIPLAPVPYEASMFTVDVDQRFHQLGQSLSDTVWKNLTRTNANAGVVTLPDAVVLLGTDGPLGSTPQVVRFSNSSFLQENGTQLGGAAALPSGSGSIKAAKLMQEGLCSTFTPYSDLFAPIDATLRDSLVRGYGATCFDSGIDHVSITQENFASFLAHESAAPTDARGGFLMNLGVEVRVTQFPLNFWPVSAQTCRLTTTLGLEPYLDGYGVLNVYNGLESFAQVNGKGQYLPGLLQHDSNIACNGGGVFFPPYVIVIDGAADRISETLGLTLTHQIRAIAESRQYYPSLNDTSFDDDARFACDPAQYDRRYTCPVRESDSCEFVSELVRAAVVTAATGFGATAANAAQLGDTLTERDPSSNGMRLKRWRCVARPATRGGQACVDPHKGRCELIVPMKRINTRPDGIESVFFDRLDDYSNAALGVFFASFLDKSLVLHPEAQDYRQICSAARPVAQAPNDLQNYSTRTFATFTGAPTRCDRPDRFDQLPQPPPCAKSCADLSTCFEPPPEPPFGSCP